MPKYNVKYNDGVDVLTAKVEAPTPEAAADELRKAGKILFVSEAKRGRPPKVSLVAPDPN